MGTAKSSDRRGRPAVSGGKQAIKLRIDNEVLEHYRATGPGWHSRINEALRRDMEKKS